MKPSLRIATLLTILTIGLRFLIYSQPTDLIDRVAHHYADNEGVKIHYVSLGEGPLVVMIHGFPDFWYTWRHQMEVLSKNYRVLAVDLRGYNKSDQPEDVENYAMQHLMADIAAVIADAGEQQATIVGHDWGGAVSWALAMYRPDLVKRLIICNLPHPNGLARELASNPEQQANSQYARDFQQEGAHEKLTAEGLAFWVKDEAARPHYIEAFRRSSFEGMLNIYKANYPRPPYQQPKSTGPMVQCPVLMLHGLDDQALLPSALNDTWQWLKQDLTLITVPGAGHFVQQDAADFVSSNMHMWLARQEEATKTKAAESFISVFRSGQEGYACFRIPAILSTDQGELIAFAEGRKNGCSDTGDIDLVMKRSTDGGQTWSALQVIWDDGENVCGNPAPVLDRETGEIHLLSTWNLGSDKESQIIAQTSQDTRHVYVLRSPDGGKTWTKPREITPSTKLPTWTWYATGPGSGIQMQKGKHAGRLLIACDHIEAETKHYYSHVIYSDDHGDSWKLGGSTPEHQVNECEIAELSDGRLMLNMRNYDRAVRRRQTATSTDGGITWTDQHHDSTLIEPICQGSLQSYEKAGKHVLLFSNPASEDKREKMTVRRSDDDGKTWSRSVLIYDGPAAYSDLIVLPDEKIGCLFEQGIKSPYEQIVFVPISF